MEGWAFPSDAAAALFIWGLEVVVQFPDRGKALSWLAATDQQRAYAWALVEVFDEREMEARVVTMIRGQPMEWQPPQPSRLLWAGYGPREVCALACVRELEVCGYWGVSPDRGEIEAFWARLTGEE